MTDQEKFQGCLDEAREIVGSYRAMAPDGYDPKCVYATTTTLIILSTLALISAGVGAYGAYASAQAQSDAAKYNAAVARNSAASAAQQGEFDAQQIRDRNRRILAQQRAAMAANGVLPDSGSAADIQSDSALQGEMQALMAIYTGKTSANAFEAQSRLDRMNAANATRMGQIGVASSILGGATNAGLLVSNPNFRNT